MPFLITESFDYNNFIRQIRALCQDHPQVSKSTPLDPLDDGFTVTGTGNGKTYVTAGANMATVPFQLQCTLGGADGVATFDVIEDFGGANTNRGTLTAGVRFWFADTGEQNELIVRTISNWVIADTIDFTMVAGSMGAEAWTEDRFVEGGVTGGPPVPDGNGDFNTEWLANGPSIGGGDEINCGMLSRFNDPASRRNIEVSAADGFVGGSLFGSQPNNSPDKFLYSSNQPAPTWLVATGDYITGFTNPVAGVYQSFFLGYHEPFATAGNMPRPLVCGGMGSNDTFTVTEIADNGHSAFWDAGEQAQTGAGDGLGSLVIRWIDGLWLDFRNRNTSTSASSGEGKQFAPSRWTQPYKSQDSSFQLTSPPSGTGFDWSELSKRLVNRNTSRYNLRPVEMFITNPQSAVVGQIPAWKYIPNFGNAVEDQVQDASPVFNGVVVQNAFRTNRDSFAVLQLDV